jgi:hypothetical protein
MKLEKFDKIQFVKFFGFHYDKIVNIKVDVIFKYNTVIKNSINGC